MKSITLELTYPSGAVYRLSQPISVSIVRSLESPAQSLSASFPIIKGLLPDIGVGARLLRGGAEIFSGFCDQQVTREDEKGRTFTIQARSRGGLLLDNEALPRTYYNVTTREIFRQHLAPYGFSRLSVPRDHEAGIFAVSKGLCEWEVFCAFCMRAYGRYPIIARGDRVAVEERSSAIAAKVTNRPGEAGLRYLRVEDTLRRASVISEMILRDRQGNYSRKLQNPFGNPWQVRRRRFVIPAAEYATVPLADGYQQFLTAQRGVHVAEAVLPGWADLWPGDCVEMDTGGIGRQGAMTLWRCRWDQSSQGEYTTLTLTSRAYS